MRTCLLRRALAPGLLALGVLGIGPAGAPPPGTPRIAFASRRDGNWEIYVTDADGGRQTRLTERPGQDRFPL